MKILIAIPTFENIYPDTYRSVWNLDKADHEVDFEFIRGYDCATARNKIIITAQDRKADYVLMVDNDIELPADALINLLDEPREVCLGYYAHRNEDNQYTGRVSVCQMNKPDGMPYLNYPLESEYTAKELKQMREAGRKKVRIHGGGMGCALIRMEVIQKIAYPWYDWVNYKGADRRMLSEDLYFCEKCKAADVPIYTDTRVACGHLFRHMQWPE